MASCTYGYMHKFRCWCIRMYIHVRARHAINTFTHATSNASTHVSSSLRKIGRLSFLLLREIARSWRERHSFIRNIGYLPATRDARFSSNTLIHAKRSLREESREVNEFVTLVRNKVCPIDMVIPLENSKKIFSLQLRQYFVSVGKDN